jgi:hypothetical protein
MPRTPSFSTLLPQYPIAAFGLAFVTLGGYTPTPFPYDYYLYTHFAEFYWPQQTPCSLYNNDAEELG